MRRKDNHPAAVDHCTHHLHQRAIWRRIPIKHTVFILRTSVWDHLTWYFDGWMRILTRDDSTSPCQRHANRTPNVLPGCLGWLGSWRAFLQGDWLGLEPRPHRRQAPILLTSQKDNQNSSNTRGQIMVDTQGKARGHGGIRCGTKLLAWSMVACLLMLVGTPAMMLMMIPTSLDRTLDTAKRRLRLSRPKTSESAEGCS